MDDRSAREDLDDDDFEEYSSLPRFQRIKKNYEIDLSPKRFDTPYGRDLDYMRKRKEEMKRAKSKAGISKNLANRIRNQEL